MKKNRKRKWFDFLIIVAVAAAAVGCDRKYDEIFGESPDDRIREELIAYNALLLDAPYGWKAALYTGSGAAYFYYFDFASDGTVNMMSDFNVETAGEAMEGAWTLKALQRPTLSFTTYAYIHLPADPDGNINNGVPGSGLLSDFEFAFDRVAGDSVILEGLQHDSEMVIVKSTAEEKQAIEDKRIQAILNNTVAFLEANKGYRLTLPDHTEVPMAISLPYKTIAFQYLHEDGELIHIPTTSYTFSTGGIVLKQPISIHGFVIRELQWSADDNSFYIPFDPPAPLVGADEPFIFETTKPLHTLLGQERIVAVIPDGAGADPVPGQSDEFTALYNDAAASMLAGEYRLSLRDISFVFVPNTYLMYMIVGITQPSSNGPQRYTAQYTYSYNVRDDGTVKFRLEGTDANAGFLYADMLGILSHFDNDSFEAKYVGGGFNVLGGFFSQEEPNYHFAGYLTAYTNGITTDVLVAPTE